jgi:hypothetical protein
VARPHSTAANTARPSTDASACMSSSASARPDRSACLRRRRAAAAGPEARRASAHAGPAAAGGGPRGALTGAAARAAALTAGSYACFLAAETALPFLYMPDCLAATYQLMTAEPAALQQARAAAGTPGQGCAEAGRGCAQLLLGAAGRPAGAGDVGGALSSLLRTAASSAGGFQKALHPQSGRFS